MSIPIIPWQRWPVHYHAVAASLLLASLAVVVGWSVQGARKELNMRRMELQSLQSQLAASQSTAQQLAAGNFTLTLPASARSDAVVRDMSRLANTLGIQIASLNIQTQSASSRELGQIQYHLAMTADYRAAKTWLAELLGRYASLAIQTLTVRATPNDPVRHEVRVTLVLFVKD